MKVWVIFAMNSAERSLDMLEVADLDVALLA